jgi:anti-sigma factor RsiW
MNCQGYRTLLRAALEGALTEWQRGEAEDHVSECKACGAFHKQTYGVSCRELTESLDEYVDGSLASEVHTTFERHLSICIECRDYVACYRRTIALGRSAYEAGDESTPSAVPESLVRAILSARRRSE